MGTRCYKLVVFVPINGRQRISFGFTRQCHILMLYCLDNYLMRTVIAVGELGKLWRNYILKFPQLRLRKQDSFYFPNNFYLQLWETWAFSCRSTDDSCSSLRRLRLSNQCSISIRLTADSRRKFVCHHGFSSCPGQVLCHWSTKRSINKREKSINWMANIYIIFFERGHSNSLLFVCF